jgi:signal transduction histidine kinase
MLAPKKPRDEGDRLKSLRLHRVLDTDREEVFDDITDLAAAICEVPIALITFVDDDRVWLKSKVGISASETSRDVSFCGHAILQRELFLVPDAAQDKRFKDNPFVVEEPKIRFYAGAQLVDRGGRVLGMMCVLDRKPRQLRPSQQQALRVLARLVMTELELRRKADDLQQLEVETANLRLVRVMANRLLHEIGNAIVPISTHQQLLAERFGDPDFRASFDTALTEGIRRVSRLISQMRHLAEEMEPAFESMSLQAVVEEAYDSAVKNQGPHSARLHFDAAPGPILINGDVAGLTLAFSEIILNALQANPADPEVEVRCSISEPNGSPAEVIIDFRDKGDGFLQGLAEKVTLPFFSTRSVGPGLGLSVAKKVIERHHGSLEVRVPAKGEAGGVRIHLPLRPSPSPPSAPASPDGARLV